MIADRAYTVLWRPLARSAASMAWYFHWLP